MAGTILFLAVLTIYWQTAQFDFIFFDDQIYVFNNPLINHGLSWVAFCGIWTNYTGSHWHPLTLLSHQLDVTIFGLKAGGHHLTNVLLHGINAILVFLVLRAFTGTFWRAFFVAILFAVHPLHVESVAWISERKDMLSTFFGLLTLLAYLKYTSKPGWLRMALVIFLFALSLMSKAMLVTLPCLLLLLDWWPLGRFKIHEASDTNEVKPNKRKMIYIFVFHFLRLILEKLPLFLLSCVSYFFTMIAQHAGNSVTTSEHWPLGMRLSNAVVALLEYLNKMVWPTSLGVFYPLPPFGHPYIRVVLSIGFVMALSILAIALMRRRPWWFTGWFWYLGTLVPVLGLIQSGAQSWADRYTYWPLTGIFIILVWEGAILWKYINLPRIRTLASLLVIAVISTLGFTAWKQTSYWKNTELLFKHTVEVVPDNWLAHNILGTALAREGRFDESLEHYLSAYTMGPKNGKSCNNLGKIYALCGKTELSLEWHLRAITADPKSPMGYYYAANTLVKLSRIIEAEETYRMVLALDPAFSDALFNYANLLRDCDRLKEAEAGYRNLLKSKSDYLGAHINLASLLAERGDHEEAIYEYGRALELEPNNPMVLSNQGSSLLHLGRLGEAVRVLEKAVNIQPDNADIHFCFALSLAASGNRDAAIAELNTTLRINSSHPAASKLLRELTQIQR